MSVKDPALRTWQKISSGYLTEVADPVNGPLPAGSYTSLFSESKWYYLPVKTDSDELIHLPGLPIDFILNQIEKFWSKTAEYKKFGFLQKRGILFYGPLGCGKSSMVALLRNQITSKHGGVCFQPEGTSFSALQGGIQNFRRLEPDRPIMTLVEDIETLLESSTNNNNATNEKAALSFYDGENQVNNVVHIATTNKPDIIADRFIRRPGRFDIVIGVHAPTRETREAYLTHIAHGGMSNKQLTEILDQTDGLSLAYMREIASTYLVLEIPLEETISRLRTQAKAKYSSNKTGFTIGFTDNGRED